MRLQSKHKNLEMFLWISSAGQMTWSFSKFIRVKTFHAHQDCFTSTFRFGHVTFAPNTSKYIFTGTNQRLSLIICRWHRTYDKLWSLQIYNSSLHRSSSHVTVQSCVRVEIAFNMFEFSGIAVCFHAASLRVYSTRDNEKQQQHTLLITATETDFWITWKCKLAMMSFSFKSEKD